MKSKKQQKSNEKTDTPKGFKETYGARIEPKSISAGAIRSKTLKSIQTESARPPRKYDNGNTVYLNVPHIPFKNGIICGYSWGEIERDVRRAVWVYWVRHPQGTMNNDYRVTEDQITDRISL